MNLLAVMAHEGGQETFDRHIPLWRSHGWDIIVYCPSDSMVAAPPDIPVIGWGRASHHDAMANARFKFLLKLMQRLSPYEGFAVFEYDAVCIQPGLICPTSGLAGNVFRDDGPNRGFLGTTFVHPPLVFGRQALERILFFGDDIPADAERGFWDRWLGYVCELGRIELHDFISAGLGYSRNTIEPCEFPSAVEAARAGVRYFHGVKSAECLSVIMRAANG